MSQIQYCRCCGQPLPSRERNGVWLPAKKAAIFDTVSKYPGITVDGIIANLNDGSTRNTIRQHVYQINELLAETDVRIKGKKTGGWRDVGGYYIVTASVDRPSRLHPPAHRASDG